MMRSLLVVVAALTAAPLAAQEAPALFESMRTVPVVPGQWTFLTSAAGSEARFGAVFSIRCDRATRRVTLGRIGGGAGAMTIATDLGMRTIPATGVVASGDPVLDAIAFSRGRFIVVNADGSRLVLPAWPEAARSIEDCRN